MKRILLLSALFLSVLSLFNLLNLDGVNRFNISQENVALALGRFGDLSNCLGCDNIKDYSCPDGSPPYKEDGKFWCKKNQLTQPDRVTTGYRCPQGYTLDNENGEYRCNKTKPTQPTQPDNLNNYHCPNGSTPYYKDGGYWCNKTPPETAWSAW